MGERLFENWPGGITTLSGGTRVVVNRNRPWQSDIEVNPSVCPFEVREQRVISEVELGGESWQILENLFTPLRLHHLIIPKTCFLWPKERLRILGGREGIGSALILVTDLMKVLPREERYHFGCHVGSSAGQNIPHLHYHLYAVDQPAPSGILGTKLLDNPGLVISQNDYLTIAAGGHSAGQCFLVPKHRQPPVAVVDYLGGVLANLIALYDDRFLSVQGLPPDFMLIMAFRNGQLDYGTYVPILNMWGIANHSSLLGDGPMVLPWPHLETVSHLLTRSPA